MLSWEAEVLDHICLVNANPELRQVLQSRQLVECFGNASAASIASPCPVTVCVLFVPRKIHLANHVPMATPSDVPKVIYREGGVQLEDILREVDFGSFSFSLPTYCKKSWHLGLRTALRLNELSMLVCANGLLLNQMQTVYLVAYRTR